MPRGRSYCRGRLKRALDLALALPALVILAPLLLAAGLAVLALSGRPMLFAQDRVGAEGRPFRLWKLRTMRREAAGGLPITGGGDRRVTPVGRWLRATKIDELPQLVNIVRGEMSIVGPRPEVARYVSGYTPAERRVLDVRPGLTDPASLHFRNEEALLGAVEESRRERYYRDEILPRKLAMNLDYIERAGLLVDLGLILRTAKVIVQGLRP